MSKVLLVGSGGREHAIAWKLKESPGVELFVAPGNAGMAEIATLVDIKANDIEGLVNFALREKIEITIVGPEAPLVAGLADRLQEKGLLVCGPSAIAAYAEADKGWFKEFLNSHNLPTASYQAFSDPIAATSYIWNRESAEEIVIKACGLMAGKGVFLPSTKDEAEVIIRDLMVKGGPGEHIVIEERLRGFECSAIALTDGTVAYQLPFTQDYKRLRDGDEGPNTGGMGAYTITLPEELAHELTRLTQQVVTELKKEGCEFRGFIYLGFMITESGPKILELNCRLGDPETEVIMLSMGGDFLELCCAAAEGNLLRQPSPQKLFDALCVVMATGDYPGPSTTDDVIEGLPVFDPQAPVQVFHAGTGKREGQIVTNKAGRVLVVSACGPSVAAARALAYDQVAQIEFPGAQFRTDIGAGID